MFCKTLEYIDLFKPLHAENGIGNMSADEHLKIPKTSRAS
jgi:hypothetical protein